MLIYIFFLITKICIVQALMGIKDSLKDPHGVLVNWDKDAVDPCTWNMVSCSPQNVVVNL